MDAKSNKPSPPKYQGYVQINNELFTNVHPGTFFNNAPANTFNTLPNAFTSSPIRRENETEASISTPTNENNKEIISRNPLLSSPGHDLTLKGFFADKTLDRSNFANTKATLDFDNTVNQDLIPIEESLRSKEENNFNNTIRLVPDGGALNRSPKKMERLLSEYGKTIVQLAEVHLTIKRDLDMFMQVAKEKSSNEHGDIRSWLIKVEAILEGARVEQKLNREQMDKMMQREETEQKQMKRQTEILKNEHSQLTEELEKLKKETEEQRAAIEEASQKNKDYKIELQRFKSGRNAIYSRNAEIKQMEDYNRNEQFNLDKKEAELTLKEESFLKDREKFREEELRTDQRIRSIKDQEKYFREQEKFLREELEEKNNREAQIRKTIENDKLERTEERQNFKRTIAGLEQYLRNMAQMNERLEKSISESSMPSKEPGRKHYIIGGCVGLFQILIVFLLLFFCSSYIFPERRINGSL